MCYRRAVESRPAAVPRTGHGHAAEHCPLCVHSYTGRPVSLREEPWHFLTCNRLKHEQHRRHNAVVETIARVAWLVGGQVQREVTGLDPRSKQRPDMQVRGLDPHSNQRPDIMLVFPGRVLLADVSVSHSLTPAQITNGSAAASQQSKKNAKYAAVATRLGAELLNLAVDSCGGMALGASRLIEGHSRRGCEVERRDVDGERHPAPAAWSHRYGRAARQWAGHAGWVHAGSGGSCPIRGQH